MANPKGRKSSVITMENGDKFELTDMARKKRISPRSAYDRWYKLNCPEIINTEMFEHIFRPVRGSSQSSKPYSIDGVRYGTVEMVKVSGISASTLHHHRSLHGKVDYTSAEISGWKDRLSVEKVKVRKKSKWSRGPSIDPVFGSDMTPEQRSLMRLVVAW